MSTRTNARNSSTQLSRCSPYFLPLQTLNNAKKKERKKIVKKILKKKWLEEIQPKLPESQQPASCINARQFRFWRGSAGGGFNCIAINPARNPRDAYWLTFMPPDRRWFNALFSLFPSPQTFQAISVQSHRLSEPCFVWCLKCVIF